MRQQHQKKVRGRPEQKCIKACPLRVVMADSGAGDIVRVNLRRIYLDYAATTPTHAEVMKAVLPCFAEALGNPLPE